MERVILLMSLYSESQHKLAIVAVDYILPSLQLIVDRGTTANPLSRTSFNQILDCLMYFLQMREDKAYILKSYDVTHLLLSLVAHEALFEDIEILKKLEDIVKAVFYSPGVLNPSGEKFVALLLRHPRHDFNKLGIFSLYCIALGLQDKQS